MVAARPGSVSVQPTPGWTGHGCLAHSRGRGHRRTDVPAMHGAAKGQFVLRCRRQAIHLVLGRFSGLALGRKRESARTHLDEDTEAVRLVGRGFLLLGTADGAAGHRPTGLWTGYRSPRCPHGALHPKQPRSRHHGLDDGHDRHPSHLPPLPPPPFPRPPLPPPAHRLHRCTSSRWMFTIGAIRPSGWAAMPGSGEPPPRRSPSWRTREIEVGGRDNRRSIVLSPLDLVILGPPVACGQEVADIVRAAAYDGSRSG